MGKRIKSCPFALEETEVVRKYVTRTETRALEVCWFCVCFSAQEKYTFKTLESGAEVRVSKRSAQLNNKRVPSKLSF